MKRARIASGVLGGLMCCGVVAALAQSAQPAPGATPAPAAKHVAKHVTRGLQSASLPMETTGELKFQQNCSRCHDAPQELSTRVSGTVVMHMRVRASLSEADAKAILRYLAP